MKHAATFARSPCQCGRATTSAALRVEQLAALRVSLWFTFFLLCNFRGRGVATGMGTAMDNTAFHELIEQVRGAAAELAQAEQKVAVFRAELAQQEHGAPLDASSALLRSIEPMPKRVNSGWLPATDNGHACARKKRTRASAASKPRG